MKTSPVHYLAVGLLKAMALALTLNPAKRRYLFSTDGPLECSLGFTTENGSVAAGLILHAGRARAVARVPRDADTVMIFKDDRALLAMLSATPNEVLNMLLKSQVRIRGNLTYANLFNFLVSLLMGKRHVKMMRDKKRENRAAAGEYAPAANEDLGPDAARRGARLSAPSRDPGVKVLDDPYLPEYGLDDFPRLARFLDIHFTQSPEISAERPRLLTEWFREFGFETRKDGRPWEPELRQARAFAYLMENRCPMIRAGDLLAGTTTDKEIGVVIYPDSHGTMIWGELLSVQHRELNPYAISDETVRVLHHEVFPFWAKRNFREWVRDKYGDPLCQRLDERFAVYFLWKTAALSHTIPDFPRLMALGARGLIREMEEELARDPGADLDKRNTLKAMAITLNGLVAYAQNLSREARRQARSESDPRRRAELLRMAETCARVPEHPCETLFDAVQCVWIAWIGLHMENTNAGLSMGRLDQWLQPFFLAGAAGIRDKEGRRAYVRDAIELIGCLFMRLTDHLPLVPDIGNYLFGGSSSDQAITLGGVTPEGEDAVCDMTYVFLKVTEMLGLRDPNVNARFHPEKNSPAYLARLCEVNYITAATPSLHNDQAVFQSLAEFGYDPADLRDWSATGCVEPTLSGVHIGHTNCMMMNMVAALEMAMNNGRHPLMEWKVGPDTGSVETGDFTTFDRFFEAFCRQFEFLIEQSVEYNNLLGLAHQEIRPTPLLSSLIRGTVEKGRDVTRGGAKYNTSGAAVIGLADVTDSLMAVKKLVFEEGRVSLTQMKKAVDANFEGYPAIHALVKNKVPLFGSGSPEAVDQAKQVAKFAHDAYGRHVNYRGGTYTAGFWSMSNHVAFGNLAGALPSGRLARKAFTPGLTPQPHASPNLLDNIRDVAALPPELLNNNIAFNVKVVPAANDPHDRVVDNMRSYVSAYFGLGGMQMQMNVVTSAMLKDAMAHPENHRNLLVRISGYNAYFVTLNRDMQLELIERAQYGI